MEAVCSRHDEYLQARGACLGQPRPQEVLWRQPVRAQPVRVPLFIRLSMGGCCVFVGEFAVLFCGLSVLLRFLMLTEGVVVFSW